MFVFHNTQNINVCNFPENPLFRSLSIRIARGVRRLYKRLLDRADLSNWSLTCVWPPFECRIESSLNMFSWDPGCQAPKKPFFLEVLLGTLFTSCSWTNMNVPHLEVNPSTIEYLWRMFRAQRWPAFQIRSRKRVPTISS